MQIIKISDTGSAESKQTEQLVKEVIAKNEIDAVVEKIEDIQLIMEYNILATPAVVVDEVVKIKGRVPSEKEILEAIK
jgi:small redox-active disulfide protein 2